MCELRSNEPGEMSENWGEGIGGVGWAVGMYRLYGEWVLTLDLMTGMCDVNMVLERLEIAMSGSH